MPYVDDQYFEPTDKALTWIERTKVPEISTIATVDGRKVIQIIYPEKGSFGRTIGTIMLASETARDSEWYAPFFAAMPELFRGQIVSSEDVSLGYIATLEWSGTGGFRSHHLFDLRAKPPLMRCSVDAGRLRSVDFKTEAEYQQALKIYDREKDLLSGILPKETQDPSAK